VLDIPMAPLTKQYLAYVDQIRTHNLELAAEYLLMAALLIEIKSRMLLPLKKSDGGEPGEDPRAELVRRLVEYERIKLAAARLDELPRVNRDFLRALVTIEQTVERRVPDVTVVDLRQAWADVFRRARLHAHHHIAREELSVREHMSSDLFDDALLRRGAPVVIVHFLALLELARENLIEITQAAPFAPIYVRLAYGRG
jgi:segregation and condensation protein A